MARILHVIHELSLGGAARSMAAISKYSARRSGHEHAVLSLVPPAPGSIELAREAGMRVLADAAPETVRSEMAAADIVQVHWWNVPEMRALFASGLPAARLMLFYHVAGDGLPHIITPGLAGFADLNVPCNPYSYRELDVFARMDEPVRRERVAMVYDAADFGRLAGLERTPHPGFNVGYIGTVDFVKMHQGYVEMSAAADVPEARFIVCGGGGALEPLKAKAAGLGQSGRFDFRGYVEDIRPVLAVLDAYGYPLCEDTYAAGELNLQEVMYAGIPPIVFPYGGVKSLVIHDYTGLVVHSAAEYAEAIEHLYRHPAERARLGANAAAYARQIFGAENAAVKMDALYARMLARPKRERAWPGPPMGAGGADAFVDTLGNFGGYFRTSREQGPLRELLAADEAIAASTRLAFLSGILAWRGKFPDDPCLRYWAGLNFSRSGMHSEALLEYAAAIQGGFAHWRAHWRLLQAAEALGRADLVAQARALLDKRQPDYRRLLENLGSAQSSGSLGASQPAAALPAAPEAAASPASGHVGGEAGGAASRGRRPEADGASATIGTGEGWLPSPEPGEEGPRRNPASEARHRQGLALRDRGDAAGAMQAFLEALKSDPDNAPAAIDLGRSLRNSGMDHLAIQLQLEFIARNPGAREVAAELVAAEKRWAEWYLARCRIRDTGYRRKDYAVTALVSTYASAGFMRECLDDLESQTLAGALEIIVVDAASPEDEGSIVEEYQLRHGNIRYVRAPERIGIYPAWNLGIHLAAGRYLTPFSTNDRLNPKAYEILAGALDSHPYAALAYGDSHLTDLPHQKFAEFARSEHYGGAFVWPAYGFEDLLRHCRIGPHPIWRREVHEEIGRFDARYKAIGDQDFWLRLGRSRQMLHVPEFTGLVWLTRDSLSGDSTAAEEIREIQSRHLGAYLSRGLDRVGRTGRGPGSVTAVVAASGDADSLRDCLRGLGDQALPGRKALEVVVTGAVTPDESAVLEESRGRLALRHLAESAGMPPGTARNLAVRASAGDYLVRVEAGDRLFPGALDGLAAALDSGDGGLVHARVAWMSRARPGRGLEDAETVTVPPPFSIRQALIDCPFGGLAMWRRESHRGAGLFDPYLDAAVDYEFFLRLAFAKGVRDLDEILCLRVDPAAERAGRREAEIREGARFLDFPRRNLPLQAIYPGLGESPAREALGAAALDFGALLLDPRGIRSPEAAMHHLCIALKELGPVAGVLHNLALAQSDLGRHGEAESLRGELARRFPEFQGMAVRLAATSPGGRFLYRPEHPAVASLPPVRFAEEMRVPFPEYRAQAPERTVTPA